MSRYSSAVAFSLALLLHAGLIAWLVIGLPAKETSLRNPASIAVRLLPVQETEAPEALPSPPAPQPPSQSAPPPPAKKIPAAPKVRPKAKAKATVKPPAPRARPEPETASSATVPAPASNVPGAESPPATQPPAAAETPSAPPPQAKTSVYISAEYKASNRKPAYPPMSRRYREEGTVILQVLVKADGTAGQVEVKSSSGYPLLDKSAMATVQGWRFNPATMNGKPVDNWFPIPITFKLED